MSDKPLTLHIPEQLLQRAQTANIDLNQTFIDALEQALAHQSAPSDTYQTGSRPTLAEVEAAIRASEARLASPDAPRRILGLHPGTVWMSDDFTDELPDEFWLGDGA